MPTMTWKAMTLNEVAEEFVNGGTPSTKVPEYWSGDIPWITGADISDFRVSGGRKRITMRAVKESSTHLVPERTVLLVTRTSVGKAAITTNPLCFSQDITGIKCKPIIRPEYLARYLTFMQDSLVSRVRGSTIKGLARADFAEIRVPVPPLEAQDRIADVIERGETIGLRRRQSNQLTGKIIQSVFLKLFGDPTELPDKYQTKKLQDLAMKRRYAISSGPFGSNLGTKDYVQNGVLVVRGTNVKANEFDQTDCKYVSEDKARELTRSLAGPRDLVVVAVGASGRACIVPSTIQQCLLSQNCNKVSIDESIANPEYVCYSINTEYFQSQLSRMTTDTVRRFLSMTNVAKFEVPLPPLAQQQKFAGIFSRMERLKQRQRQGTREINELFQSLMQKAFSGELI
jgi:type I restriction enzyme S subunit